jgi:ferredoxin
VGLEEAAIRRCPFEEAEPKCARQRRFSRGAEWWGGCLRCTRPAPVGGSPGPAVHQDTGQVGSGGHQTNVDGGGRSGTDGTPRGWEAQWVQAVKLCPVGAVSLPGLWRSPGSPPSQGAAEKILVWPVTL